MVSVGISISGNKSFGKEKMAIIPKRTIATKTIMVVMGRFTDISANFIRLIYYFDFAFVE